MTAQRDLAHASPNLESSERGSLRGAPPETQARALLVAALDGSVRPASVALAAGGSLLGEWSSENPRAASQLLAELDGLLCNAGCTREELDGVVAVIGPGSFTGTRLAVALAWGIVLGGTARWATITTFEALGLAAPAHWDRALGAVPSVPHYWWCKHLVRSPSGMIPAGPIEERQDTALKEATEPLLLAGQLQLLGSPSEIPESLEVGPLAPRIARTASAGSWPWELRTTRPRLELPPPRGFHLG